MVPALLNLREDVGRVHPDGCDETVPGKLSPIDATQKVPGCCVGGYQRDGG